MTPMHDEEMPPAARLIGLKRYETPGEAYFERFLCDFRERQRVEMLRVSAPSLVRERIITWLDCLPVPGVRAAAACGAVCLAGVVLWWTGQAGREQGSTVPIQVAEAASFPEVSLIREF